MSIEKIKPTSLVGIKRLAKSLKSIHNCSHTDALDLAAVQSGFSNLRHAQNVLVTENQFKHTTCTVCISSYWRDKNGNSGREILILPTSSAWKTTYKVSQLYNVKSNRDFSQIAVDHIETTRTALSQDDARFIISKAARTIQFMDATGLKPTKGGSRAYPKGSYRNDIPEHDHSSVWYHPASKSYVIADEPYEAAVADHHTERAAWALAHDFRIVKPIWQGMYNPEGGSQIYLIASNKKNGNVVNMSSALDNLPIINSEQWNGISEPWSSTFVSDGTRAKLTLANVPRIINKKTELIGTRKQPGSNMNPYRKLLVLGVNELLKRNLLSLVWDGTRAASGHLKIEIAGHPSVVLWHDAGHGEMKISVWWQYNNAKHPQVESFGDYREKFEFSAPLAKRSSYKNFVGVISSGWFERQEGTYIQGKGNEGIYEKYARAGELAILKTLRNPEPLGYDIEGPFHM